MGTLKEDIKYQSDWIVKAFSADRLLLDYSINSFINIDKFFIRNSSDGSARKGGRLDGRLGPVLFSIGSYIGETIISNIPGSVWVVDDEAEEGELEVYVQLPDGTIVFPVQRVMKRFKNGVEDSIYIYGFELTRNFLKEEFDTRYWDIIKTRSWWKIW